jgi:hemerythrin superfamily protein
MKATDLLEKDHRQVERLFARLLGAKTPAPRVKAFLDVRAALTLHARLEESVFYPAVRTAEDPEVRAEVSHALSEHDEVKALLAEIEVLDPADLRFLDRCRRLRDEVAGHVKEEESKLFPRASRLLGSKRLESLGRRIADARTA